MPHDPHAALKSLGDDMTTSAVHAEPVPASIAELDRVVLARAVESDDGALVPAGATGTVVGIWAGGSAFEVEFAQPFSALATVAAEAIGGHRPRR